MSTLDFESRIQNLEAALRKRQAAIEKLQSEQEFDSNLLDAYQTVLNDQLQASKPLASLIPSPVTVQPGLSMKDRILNYAREIGSEFSLDDLFSFLNQGEQKYERPNLSYALSRMRRDKQIIVVEEGKGRKSGTFIHPDFAPKHILNLSSDTGSEGGTE